MEITWNIAQLDCYPEHEGQTNVIAVAHWRVTATDGKNTTGAYGTQGITFDPETLFVPVEELDEQTVLGWVQSAMGKDYTELMQGLEAELVQMANPPMVSISQPWGS